MPDVNGIRHHLLLGAADWGRCSDSETQRRWTYDRGQEAVTLTPLPFEFPRPRGDRRMTLADRRGATRDRYGHWYWIGDTGQSVRVRWAAGSGESHYWSAADPRRCVPPPPTSPFVPGEPVAAPDALSLAGLAATTGHYLAVGTRGGLLLFDLHTGGAPMRVALPPTPNGEPTQPFDLAPLTNGGLVVLDKDHRLLWVLDATFRPVSPAVPMSGPVLVFQTSGATQARREAQSAAPTPLLVTDCQQPISVEPLPDGSFVVLDQPDAGQATIRRYVLGRAGAVGSVDLVEDRLRPPDTAALGLQPIRAHDMAFVPDAEPSGAVLGTLFVVHADGNQVFGLRLSLAAGLTLGIEPKFYPLRSHTGRALVAPLGGRYAYYDQGAEWLALAELPRRRYLTNAEVLLPPLDGRDPGCVWHRLCLDACLPPTTRIEVYTRASDELALLSWQPWQPEPAPYQRGGGAEIPYYSLWSSAELGQPATGTWELLFQRAIGRYMQIRLVLCGDGRSTPVVRALRAHYPRFSYLANYLPDLYQDDPASTHFLDRFLANPEGLFTALEGLIASAQVLFDPRTSPSEAVDWLAGWIGLAFEPTWGEHQRRLLLANTPYFFQRRGTLAGIAQAVRIAIDPQAGPDIFQDQADAARAPVRIVEHYWTRHVPSLTLGDPTAEDVTLTGDAQADAAARAHRFTVLLPTTVCADSIPNVEHLVEQVILLEKPAHTAFTIKQFWALFRVGEVRLGLDTTLGAGGRFAALRLDRTALAEGYLSAAYPADLTDRVVLDR